MFEKQENVDIETTDWNGKTYDVRKLLEWAEQFPVEQIPLDTFREQISEDHFYWIDTRGEKLGPAQMFKDWEAAKHNPAWEKHVYGIEHANLDNPIWLIRNGDRIEVVNGVHRLARAFHENKPGIAARILPGLPEFAVLKPK
jgi:hypothetical protein